MAVSSRVRADRGISNKERPMRNPLRHPLARLFTCVALLLLVSSVAFAQRGQRGGRGNQPPPPSVPHDPDDLQGIWRGGGMTLSNTPPPMTAWGKEQFD